MGSGPAEVVPVRIDPELRSAIEARARHVYPRDGVAMNEGTATQGPTGVGQGGRSGARDVGADQDRRSTSG